MNKGKIFAHFRNLIALIIVLSTYHGYALQNGNDSTSIRKIKTPKHYFIPSLSLDFYSNAKKNLDTSGNKYAYFNKRLKSYQYKQTAGALSLPLFTKDIRMSDTVLANFHLLATGSFLLAQPVFEGIETHTLLKGSLGLRFIYNSGKKSIWYYDITPFFSQDLSNGDQFDSRMASTLIYDRIVSDNFSWRVGITRTFLFGDRLHLPYLGLRVGKLDKTYLSIQFPKKVTFSFRMGNQFRGNLFTKPLGGLYKFSNTDSIYFGVDKTILFGRYELLSGFKLDYIPTQNFGAFISLGRTTRNYIVMAGTSVNKADKYGQLIRFYEQALGRSGFINAGITVRIGKAKNIYNNRNLYEVFDLNNSESAGDNNTEIINNNIPSKIEKIKKLEYSDVQDIIDAQDLY